MFNDEFAWTHRLNTNWSLTRNVNAGLRANLQAQKQVQKNLHSLLQQGAEHEMVKSAELRRELAYQAERLREHSDAMIDAVDHSSESIVEAIQQMSDYLGAGLSEVRFAIERHTRVSIEILRVLLESLDNMSRQYFEQGIKWYENSEYELAKDRFSKALDANLTNYFAYQYLGFIAVAQDDSNQAIRNFDLAQKIADNSYHKALALSHLARCHHATGDLDKAAAVAKVATEIDPDTAKFWYEFAGYSARLRHNNESISGLREAVERDWNYFVVVATDNDFDLARTEVNELLNDLRTRQGNRARKALDELNRALDTGRKVGAGDNVSGIAGESQVLEQAHRQNNVFLHNDIISSATQLHGIVFETATNHVQERALEKRNLLQQADAEKRQELRKLQDSVDALKRNRDRLKADFKWKGGCGTFVLSFAGYFMVISVISSAARDRDVTMALAISFFVVPFLIPLAINAIRYFGQVTAPQNDLASRIAVAKREADSETRRIEERHKAVKSTTESELRVLEGFLEKCRSREYV